MKIAYIYYQKSSFVEQDCRILMRHFDVEPVSYRTPYDVIKMAKIIKASDISYSWFASGHSFLAVLLSKLMGKKSVVVAGGYDVAYEPEIGYGQYVLSWQKRSYASYVLRNADLILAVSDFTRKEVLARAKPKKVEVIYNGIDTDKFKPHDRKDDMAMTVASGSNIISLKGLDAFVEAAAHLPEIKFLIVGVSDHDRKILEDRIHSDNLELKGRVSSDGLIALYQRAKVYCQLSYRESFGVALAEAMACGCVPVVTNRGALPEVVNGVGFFVSYGDGVAAAEAIAKALDSSKGREARELVERKFSLKKRENRLLSRINRLVVEDKYGEN